jgi:N-acyl-L-homoserine lactone synthetase
MSMVLMGSSGQLSARVLNLMHLFRHEVFVERLKWSLPLVNGMERDQYDTMEAKYIVISDGSERIKACARLLPTTGAYMLPELFPQLLGGESVPTDPSIWELSRFATSVRATREGRVLSFSKPTLEFLDLIFGFARQQGITRLLFVTSLQIERLMLRAGIRVHRIAAPALIGDRLSIALFIEMTESKQQYSSFKRPPHSACPRRQRGSMP